MHFHFECDLVILTQCKVGPIVYGEKAFYLEKLELLPFCFKLIKILHLDRYFLHVQFRLHTQHYTILNSIKDGSEILTLSQNVVFVYEFLYLRRFFTLKLISQLAL